MWSMKTSQPDIGLYAKRGPDIRGAAAHIIQGDGEFALIACLSTKSGEARAFGALAIVEPDGEMIGFLSNETALWQDARGCD